MGTVHAKEKAQADKGPASNFKLDGIKARVDKVHIEGLRRTKDEFVVEKVRELLQATDFQDVILRAHKVRAKLESLGCFRNVGILIDTSSGPDATPQGLEVTFHVKELKRIIGSVNTLIGNNEGSIVVGVSLPNMCGRAEKIQTEYSYGSKKTSGFNASFTKPLLWDYNALFSASVFQQGSEWPWSGYKQIERGLLVNLGFESAPQVQHNIQWEGVWRELSCLSRTTSFMVREYSGHTLKSSLRHILLVDRRDAPVFPAHGAFFKLTTELAGIGGDVGFLKNEMHLEANYPLRENMVIQGALQGGLLHGLFKGKTYSICDHFFLGGPLNLRGFHTRGVGPHSEGNAIGGEVYVAGALHLYSSLPFKLGQGGFGDLFRVHYFVNAGNVGTFAFTEDIPNNLLLLAQNMRFACGLGLALRLGQVARVELNYCVPILKQKSDQVNPGVQFGVGVSFL